MLKKIFTFTLLLASASALAQEVITPQGDSYTNSNGSIDFTIGEVAINTGTAGGNDLTQGFHQTNWNFVSIEDHVPNYEAIIFPNPTAEILTIKTNMFENVNYTLCDAQGKLVIQDKLSSAKTPIQVSHLAPGAYALILHNDTQNLKTFQLIKQQ
mgnify:CR=1 FL=1